jgi:hypothetical protein
MKLEQSFQVPAPAEQVWALLVDLERVAPCLPGAEITGHDEDGTYRGTFTVKLGPTTASYRGQISFAERDDEAHRAVMNASGQDKRGQGGATATMVSTVVEDGGATTVNVQTDFVITGKLARFGRGGMIEDISNRLLGDFAACLQRQLAPEPQSTAASAAEPPPPPAPAQPIDAGSLAAGMLADRAKRSPIPAAALLLLLVILFRRRRRS